MSFWSVAFTLVGLSFVGESAGLYIHELNAALAVLFLTLGASLNLPRGDAAASPDRQSIRWGVAAAVVGLLLIPTHLSMRFFGAALWFWGLDEMARARGRRHGGWTALAVGSVAIGVFQVGYASSVLSWYAVQDASARLSDLVSRLAGQNVSLGPTFSGLALAPLAAGVLLGGLLVSSRRRPLHFCVAVVASGAAYLVYLLVFAAAPAWFTPLTPANLSAEASSWDHAWRFIYPLRLPLLLPLLLALPIGWYLRGVSAPSTETKRDPRNRPVLIAALAAVLGVWALTNVPAAARPGVLKAALYKKGLLNWMVPDHTRYGSRSGGMFGNMPLLLQRMGWEGELVENITAETLAGRDILVIMNQMEALPAESIQEIDRFLRDGGSLLLLGDHTFYKSAAALSPAVLAGTAPLELVLNEPLGTTGIRYNFDSAYYFIGGWLHSMYYAAHQVTAALKDATNESGCVVGASLDVQYPAVPLVVGRFGYSDPGELSASQRGYMGNSAYDPGEPLGDVVLVAAQNVGKGRVVVVGDTSGFVNSIQTQTWPFVQRVFHWLGSTGRACVPRWRDLLGIALLGAVALVTIVTVRSRTTLLPVCAAALVLAVFTSRLTLGAAGKPAPLRGKVALVDMSHVGLHSMEAWRPHAITGVYLNLMRNGYFAIGSKKFDADQILAADLVITIVPTQSYSRSELSVLRRFMEQGGTLILSTGWEERAGALSLLDMVGLEVLHRPLGRASVPLSITGLQPEFWVAWPVTGGDETIVAMRGEPVIVRKQVGQGQIVVIGDPEFLLNKNLEVEEGAMLPNVRFFSWLLECLAAPEAA